MKKRYLWGLLLVPLLMAPAPGGNMAWVSGTMESNPLNTDPVSQGDDWIRSVQKEVRRRLQAEIEFGSGFGGVSGDNGLFRVGSARCFVQANAPIKLEDDGSGTNQSPGDYNNTGAAGVTALNANESIRSPARKVGLGRCWIQPKGPDGVAGTSDDYAEYIYTAASGWVQISEGFSAASQLKLGRNLLQNSSFESGSGTSAPDGWTAYGTPLIGYGDVSVASSGAEGAGQYISVDATGSDNEGVQQTITGLKASHDYLIVARAAAVGGTCSIVTTGATVNASATTTTTGSFENLVSTFTTDNVGSGVVVIAKDNTEIDTNACYFDHMGVFELGISGYSPVIPSASSWYTSYSNHPTPGGAGNYDAVGSQTFLVEAANCYFDLRGNLFPNSGSASDTVKLTVSVNGGGATTLSQGASTVSTTGGSVMSGLLRPVVGSTYLFKISAHAGGVSDLNAVLDVAMRCPGD